MGSVEARGPIRVRGERERLAKEHEAEATVGVRLREERLGGLRSNCWPG